MYHFVNFSFYNNILYYCCRNAVSFQNSTNSKKLMTQSGTFNELVS